MRLLACAMCVACGSSGGASDARDASPTDATPDDVASPRCDVTSAFGAPVLVAGVNTSDNDRWGWLTSDEQTMYFTRAAAGGNTYDTYTATRVGSDFAFANAIPLDAVNTILGEARPVLTGDGLTLYLEVVYSTGVDIEVSTRADTAAAFSSHAPIPVIDTPKAEFNPWITDDGLVLYFTSDRDGYNDIFKSARQTTSADFDTPVAVSELNSSAGDYMGALSRDGLEIFIGSSRDTNLANGDIFHATRATPSDPFDPPTKLAELSSASTSEFPTWVSADRCQLLFFSDRNGTYDIWTATRSP